MTTTYFYIRPNPTADTTANLRQERTKLPKSYFHLVEDLLNIAPNFFEKTKGASQKCDWKHLATKEPKSTTPFLDRLQSAHKRSENSSTKNPKPKSTTPFLDRLLRLTKNASSKELTDIKEPAAL